MRFDAMDLKLYDTLTREKRRFQAARSGQRAHVCVRADGLRLRPYRQCAAGDRVRRAVPPAAPLYGADHVTYVRNITDVDDKINARAAEEYPDLPLNEAIRKVTEKTDRQFHEDVAALGCLPPTVEPRATEHIAEMRTLIERLVAVRQRLCGRGPRAVQRAVDARLRQAVEAPARRDDRRRPRRGRALQARPDGLRAVEAVEAGRAGVAVARRHHGARPARLAHRVLGDVVEISRRDLRHPRRRHRPRVSRTTRTRSRNRAAPSTRR